MSVRTVGLEEELMLVDPDTGALSARATEVLRTHREAGPVGAPAVASDDLEQELFRHQVETRTDPTTDVGDAWSQVVAARRTAGLAARARGLAVVAAGVVPMWAEEPRVSPDERYRAMLEAYGAIALSAGTCGMHVHVGIESPEEGVGVIDRIAPWLPVLLAVSANSPFADGRDTGYASWRSQVWTRWPSAGPTEPFGSLEGYREVVRLLQLTGAARDDGMLYFDARLSAEHPTVEVRVLDVCTDPADAALLAALVRALVEHTAQDWRAGVETPTWRAEILRAAHWRSARVGLGDRLLDPVSCELRPAREVLDGLVRVVRPQLEEAGDLELVAHGVEGVLRAGGATRQRAAYERTGDVGGVVADLIARTERTWAEGL